MKLLIPIVIVLLAATIIRAQSDKSISDAAISQMIGIVLRDEFRPAEEPKTIYLSERFLKPAWLPKIPKIDFVLITDKEGKERGKVHFFDKAPYWEDGFVKVDFGFGDRECSASGKSWFFQVTRSRVKRMKLAGGWGRGCDSGAANTKMS